MMKFRVSGERTIHFDIEVDASSYKDLESKLGKKDTLDFYTHIKYSIIN